MKSIAEYENRLQAMREDYIKRINAIYKDTHHTEEPVEKDFAEQVSQRENDDVLGALNDDAKQIVMQIDNALLRIKNGEYGVCCDCGKDIPEARLDAVPYAEYCIVCAEKK